MPRAPPVSCSALFLFEQPANAYHGDILRLCGLCADNSAPSLAESAHKEVRPCSASAQQHQRTGIRPRELPPEPIAALKACRVPTRRLSVARANGSQTNSRQLHGKVAAMLGCAKLGRDLQRTTHTYGCKLLITLTIISVFCLAFARSRQRGSFTVACIGKGDDPG